MKNILKLFLPAFLFLVISGCASHPLPKPSSDSDFMKRAQTKTDENVTVTVSAMSPKEAKQYFGVALAKYDMQPVWIKIANNGAAPYIFLQYSVDPQYYTPAEAAFRARRRLIEGEGIFKPLSAVLLPVNLVQAGPVNRRTAETLSEDTLNNTIILPHEEKSGYVYTRLDEGMKAVRVGLLGDNKRLKFDFVVDVPGIHPDFKNAELDAFIKSSKSVAMVETQVRQYLDSIPCCTTSRNGKKFGDPLNLVLIGDSDDIMMALSQAGWDLTEKLTWSTTWKAINAFFHGKGYRYSPVSDLYFDGRPQSAAFQRIRSNINERIHLRLWYTPNQFDGKTVWVGQVSRDIGVKFTMKGFRFTTHLIDPDVDEMRDYMFADLAVVERVAKAGYVKGVGAASQQAMRKNLTDDPYYTDGYRLVLEISDYDVAEPHFLGWETPWKNKLEAELNAAAEAAGKTGVGGK